MKLKQNLLIVLTVIAAIVIAGCQAASPGGGGGTAGPTAKWQTVGSAGFTPGSAESPSMVVDSSDNLYVLFADGSTSPSDRASLMEYDGTSWTSYASAISDGDIDYPSLGLTSAGLLYSTMTDDEPVDGATVNLYTLAGLAEIDLSNNQAQYVSVAIDSNNNAIVGYLDDTGVGGSNTITVDSYDPGSGITSTLDSGFSLGRADYISVAVNSSDVPYVAFSDDGDSGKAYVDYYNAASGGFQTTQGGGVTSGRVDDLDLVIDSNDDMYLAYREASTGQLSVQKWDGSSWSILGSSGVSAGSISSPSIAVDSNNQPYVAYSDNANSDAITVVMFNGSSWQTVGSAGFSPGKGFEPSIVIDSADIPHVVFMDDANGNALTAMSYQ